MEVCKAAAWGQGAGGGRHLVVIPGTVMPGTDPQGGAETRNGMAAVVPGLGCSQPGTVRSGR